MTDLKHEIEEILHPEKKKLHPPRAPKEFHIDLDTNIQHKLGSHTLQESMAGETEEGKDAMISVGLLQPSPIAHVSPDSKPAINKKKRTRKKLKWGDCTPEYKAWCLASETFRFYIFTNEGQTSRVSGENAMDEIEIIQQKRDFMDEIAKIDPNKRNFSNVMNEFKAKVEALKNRKRSS